MTCSLSIKTQQKQIWLQEHNVIDLSRSLVRQYLIQNAYFNTLKTFQTQEHKNANKISKSKIVNMLCMNTLVYRNHQSTKPFQSLLQILVAYLVDKFKQKIQRKSKQHQQQQPVNSLKDYTSQQQQHQETNQSARQEVPKCTFKKSYNVQSQQEIHRNNHKNKQQQSYFMGNQQQTQPIAHLQHTQPVTKINQEQPVTHQQQIKIDQQQSMSHQQQTQPVMNNHQQPTIIKQQQQNNLPPQQKLKQQVLSDSVIQGKKQINLSVPSNEEKVNADVSQGSRINKMKKPNFSKKLKNLEGQTVKLQNDKEESKQKQVSQTQPIQPQSMHQVHQQPQPSQIKKQQNKMVKVGTKKLNKPEIIISKQQKTNTTKKFKFDDNFVDAPSIPKEQPYQYEQFKFKAITIPNDPAYGPNIILKPGINYELKPQHHPSNRKKHQRNITSQQANILKKVIFQDQPPTLPKAWQQGFILSPYPQTPYGLQQIEGGPCGIIAAVQCYFLKHMYYCSQPLQIWNESRRQICLVAALTDILMKVKSNQKILLTTPAMNYISSKVDISSLKIVEVDATSFSTAYQLIWQNRHVFIGKSNHGVTILLYSIVMTKGAQEIGQWIDIKDNPLIGLHGHCTQQLVNLFLTGLPTSNVFDGQKILEDDYRLRGIMNRSQFGFLTVMQSLGHVEVGSYFKKPVFPIWIICKQFHYHIIFAPHYLIAQNNQCNKFDVIYFDGLYNCCDRIRITMQKPDDHESIKVKQMALIEQVMATRWGYMQADWNGSIRIL